MEYIILMATVAIAFVCVVYAYLIGVSHGMRVSNRSVPKPIREAIISTKEVVLPLEPDDTMEKILNYSYDAAFEQVKKERSGGA